MSAYNKYGQPDIDGIRSFLKIFEKIDLAALKVIKDNINVAIWTNKATPKASREMYIALAIMRIE